ncbi:MAG: DNA topoisomerase I [Candidatus ainarchaeum sp.]|nr:DNA topoisomerase I [Candidatus ainarchaeum sp.]
MYLIISEKAIAGKNIADFLADGKVIEKNILNAKVFEFNYNGESVRLIPLRGHISDVEFPKDYSHWQSVSLQRLVDAPIIYSKKEFSIINCIKNSALDATKIIIATDADREGESIGLEAINPAIEANKSIEIKRAYFSAITKKDIDKSFENLEKFDYNFAYSADARRELDLIWGAVLTRYVSLTSGQLGKNFLSVGRVQTPTLALIVDREKERMNFKKEKYFEIVANCNKIDEKKEEFTAMHKSGKIFDKLKADKIIEKNIKQLNVKKITTKEKIVKKPIPFNTTEFLRSAANIGVSAGKAMDLAETLYQKGFTSYPRTDNQTYSENIDLKEIVNKLASVPEFVDDVNLVLNQEKIIPSKGKETKDHPPIYPVVGVKKNMLNKDEWKIYELICRRFLATLFIDAKTENVSVLLDDQEEEFVATGQVILDAGWKKIYYYSKLNETILPKLVVDEIVNVKKIDCLEKETQPPARYSQSSLIKLMEDNNLGTKSTRPAIIQKLYSRNYILGNKSIEPSDIAFSVINSLQKHCSIVTKPDMTSELEKEMDEIAAGKKEKLKVVKDSSKVLHSILDILEKEKEGIRNDIKSSVKNSRVLTKCAKCGGDLIIRTGKTGKRFVGCNNYPKCNNSFPLPQKGTIESTDEICEFCNAPIIKVQTGRFNYKMCLTMTCKSKDSWKKKETIKSVESTKKQVGRKKDISNLNLEKKETKTKKVSNKIKK